MQPIFQNLKLNYFLIITDNLPYEKVGKNEPVCIADEVPFDIPESWEWVRLGSILSVISDGTHKTPHYVSDGIPFLSVQNISSGKFDFTKIKYITQEEHQKLIERIKPQKDDILFCRIGTLGKAIKCTLDFDFSIFVSLGLLRLIDVSLTDYLVFAINSPLGDKWIHDNKVGGGTHTYKINLVDIPRMLIPIPPLEEQKRIFDKLSIFEPLFEEYINKENSLSTLNSSFSDLLKKSILQDAVQGKLVQQDENDEPASVLLERIRAEKQALIKTGKIKKDKNESVIFRRDNSGHFSGCILELSDTVSDYSSLFSLNFLAYDYFVRVVIDLLDDSHKLFFCVCFLFADASLKIVTRGQFNCFRAAFRKVTS